MKHITKLFAVTVLMLVLGCTGIKHDYPSIVIPDQPSYEGNEPTSGVLYQISSGGFIISAKLKGKHDAYMKKYYKHFNLSSPDYKTGITPVFIIDDEVMARLLKMHSWEKNPWMLETNTAENE